MKEPDGLRDARQTGGRLLELAAAATSFDASATVAATVTCTVTASASSAFTVTATVASGRWCRNIRRQQRLAVPRRCGTWVAQVPSS